MSFNELRDLIKQLVTSWQVIAVTVVVFFYFYLVSSVTRPRYKLKTTPTSTRKKKVKKVPRKATPTAAEENLASDDLGIEEEK
jgi:hypothetical protein